MFPHNSIANHPFKPPVSYPQVEVVQTEHFSKGNQANPTFKPATLANGETIKVPPFVETGEKVVIDTEEMEYVSRAT